MRCTTNGRAARLLQPVAAAAKKRFKRMSLLVGACWWWPPPYQQVWAGYKCEWKVGITILSGEPPSSRALEGPEYKWLDDMKFLIG